LDASWVLFICSSAVDSTQQLPPIMGATRFVRIEIQGFRDELKDNSFCMGICKGDVF
jgi:hypothetical protein